MTTRKVQFMRDRMTAPKGLTRHETILVAVLLVFMAFLSVWLLLSQRNARPVFVADIVVIETEQGEDHALCDFRTGRPLNDGNVIGRLAVYMPNRPEWDDAYLFVHSENKDGLRVYEDDVEEWQDRLRRLLTALVEQGDEPGDHAYLERCATLPLVPNRR